MNERKKVLAFWPTGDVLKSEKSIEEAIAYHKEQPWYKYASLRNERAAEEGRIQITPQVGHALVNQTVDHMTHTEDLRPDRWYVLTDTYTRKSKYAMAQDAVDRSVRDGFSYLNGYPVVAHGVAGARAVNECTRAAVGTDNNDEDARLPWEIGLAGGWTWGTIKSIEELIQHSRDYPVDLNIFNQQYIDRLAAHFTEARIPILRRASANLPGWDTLGFKVTVSLLETLLSAAQGVKWIDLSLGIGMNLVQDVAAIRTLRKLAREYLDKMGMTDVKLFSWTYFFLGDWPLERGAMCGQLARDAAVLSLALADGLRRSRQRITLGADKAYDVAAFVAALRERCITPHVARDDHLTKTGKRRKTTIDGRTTCHPGYVVSLHIRKRIEETFGWIKTTGSLRKTRHRGTERVGWMFTLTAAAFNLVRLPKLMAAWPCPNAASKRLKPEKSAAKAASDHASMPYGGSLPRRKTPQRPVFQQPASGFGAIAFTLPSCWPKISFVECSHQRSAPVCRASLHIGVNARIRGIAGSVTIPGESSRPSGPRMRGHIPEIGLPPLRPHREYFHPVGLPPRSLGGSRRSGATRKRDPEPLHQRSRRDDGRRRVDHRDRECSPRYRVREPSCGGGRWRVCHGCGLRYRYRHPTRDHREGLRSVFHD